MEKHLIFLTIPALRQQDLANMPKLMALFGEQNATKIKHSFPAVTWPAQTAMLTGKLPSAHGVTANGFYWREKKEVEMWTAWNEVIQEPQLWDTLKTVDPKLTSLAWFPMLSKGCNADYVCMPAPIHKPDGSEDLWCYTRPQEFYGKLLESRGHFPLQHFWGPMANIKSSEWIANSACDAAKKFKPNFLYIYLPHLDYAAQKDGPESPTALQAVLDLDNLIGKFAEQMNLALPDTDWMIASEYTITSVDHVTFPNRLLREIDLLKVKEVDGLEILDFENSQAWALVDHQFSQVYVKDGNIDVIDQVVDLFRHAEGFDKVLPLADREQVNMNHDRAGEVILLSRKNSWQAYYWWFDDQKAPAFARTVDIHQKPGYDPVELHVDMATRSIPLDANLIKGSHGLPSEDEDQKGVFLSTKDLPGSDEITDVEIFDLVMNHFRN